MKVVRIAAASWAKHATSGHLLGGLAYGPTATIDASLLAGMALRGLNTGTPLIDGWSAGPVLHSGRHGQAHWRHDGHWMFGAIDCDPAESEGDLTALSQRAYGDIFAALAHTGVPHLVRLWNYLPGINQSQDRLERYRQFNLGRHQAFVQAGRDAQAGSPAACALGTHGGPFAVRFLASRTPALPLENPRQVPAWRYPSEFGPRSPTFSRAVLVPTGLDQLTLFISGTASIVGHASVHLGDVAAQTEETLRNLQAVIEVANTCGSAKFTLDELACTVYVRHAEDFARVRRQFEASVGAGSPAALQARYLEADVCRTELLVEIEAHATSQGHLRS